MTVQTIIFPLAANQVHNVPDKYVECTQSLGVLEPLFGDLLVRVYKELDFEYGVNQGLHAKIGYVDPGAGVDLDGAYSRPLILEFCNGRLVQMSAPEYGAFDPLPNGHLFVEE